MPYIVTTKRPHCDVCKDAGGAGPLDPCPECNRYGELSGADRSDMSVVVSRRAVATLEEAFNNVPPAVRSTLGLLDKLLALPESGGTVRLPDGTVIEVDRLTWVELAVTAKMDRPRLAAYDALNSRRARRRIIDAFNASQS